MSPGYFSSPRSLIEIRVGLARAARTADLVGHLDAEARQCANDALLEIRHVVEHRARQEKRVIGHPGVLVDLAIDQGCGDGDRMAAALWNVIRWCGKIRIVIDGVHGPRADRVIEGEEDHERQQQASEPPAL